ncbi:chitinase-like protein PB1E7.04c [Cocos nucifera]|uniref:Chitinase-like protein PB1E7.04c n=1 Tax=Cocos nucifera TaxID=13894 RepID=A0A8K0HZA4_COCNU|nr:chitinase-like protein PB1E7.04c [Cocos nucifera]
MGTKKKGYITEDDVSLLLQRYSATSILALLQEISQFASAKIDWNALVKRTSTGITNAREYQMLWRHLAYRDKLLDKVEDGTDPLDDDSDLEFELEASPALSGEALSDATACAKLLISSGSSRLSGPTNRANLGTPLTRNIPDDEKRHDPSAKQKLAHTISGTNAAVPHSVQKQPLATKRSAEVSDGNGSAGSGLPAKKKRKLWTKEEDMELLAAVQRCGEGNWANILKGDFKHNRTASQLSQRWATIRRRANLLADSGNKSVSSTRSAERLAAQKAFSLALDMPMTGSLSAILSGAAQSNMPAGSATLSASVSEASLASAPQQASIQATSHKVASNNSNMLRTNPPKPVALVKSTVGPNPLIQAAAFAAGGRIATPSTAASLLKAARSKSAFHIRHVGGVHQKSATMTAKSSPTTNIAGPQPQSVPDVQPVVTVPTPAAVSSVSSPTVPRHGMQQLQSSSQRPTSNPPTGSATVPNLSTAPMFPESKPLADLQENAESNSDISLLLIPAIDIDELLAEEVNGADEMELDGAVAKNHETDLLNLDVHENGNNIVNNAACDMQKVVAGCMDLSKSQTHESTNLANGESSESQSMNIASAQNQIVAQERFACTEAMADVVKQSCIQVEQHAVLEDTASGNQSPVDDQAVSIAAKQD